MRSLSFTTIAFYLWADRDFSCSGRSAGRSSRLTATSTHRDVHTHMSYYWDQRETAPALGAAGESTVGRDGVHGVKMPDAPRNRVTTVRDPGSF